MNFLAHSYLTFTDEQIVGQFLQDFIRNQDRFSFPLPIQEGITLHREIDTFTDAHPEIQEAKKIFSPLVRLYAGAFVDVALDYFLANSLSEPELDAHVKKVYAALKKYKSLQPPAMQRMTDGMARDNWLAQYRHDQGIYYSVQNVLNKANYLEKDLPVFPLFLNNKEKLQQHFDHFFPDLLAHVKIVEASF